MLGSQSAILISLMTGILGDKLVLLGLTAATVGVLHTAFGPDHYLPFVLMAQAERWSRAKTLWTTLVCGLGHIIGSLALGMVGIVLGLAVGQVEAIQTIRGQVAAWALIAFGLAYCIWGLRRALRNRPHTHAHGHADGTVHIHEHAHQREHIHIHGGQLHSHARSSPRRLTPWLLFTLFVFGPCEPLIPLMMYPAAESSPASVAVVTLVFGVTTLATMLGLVLVALRGMERLPMASLERYMHALAGAVITLCGLGIAVFSL